MSVPCGGDHDDVGLDAAQVLVFESEVRDDAGSEVLGEDIADRDEVSQRLAGALLGQVQGEALLVAVLFVEVDRPVPELAGGVVLVETGDSVAVQSGAGLDPHDLGAHVGEQLGGERYGDELPELDDSHTLQG